MASRDEIFDWVTGILQQEFQYEGEVRLDSHLIDDLDLDSIDAIDMTVRLEEKTGLSFKEEELKSLRTVGDVIDPVEILRLTHEVNRFKEVRINTVFISSRTPPQVMAAQAEMSLSPKELMRRMARENGGKFRDV